MVKFEGTDHTYLWATSLPLQDSRLTNNQMLKADQPYIHCHSVVEKTTMMKIVSIFYFSNGDIERTIERRKLVNK